jgi:hypothetical protein
MRKDVREFIRRLEAVGLAVESTPGHDRVLRDGKPLCKANGMPFTLSFSPDTIGWRRAAISSSASSASTGWRCRRTADDREADPSSAGPATPVDLREAPAPYAGTGSPRNTAALRRANSAKLVGWMPNASWVPV